MYIRPIVCRPKYVIRNRFFPRVQPIIHPLVEVNRVNVFTVPRHFVRPVRRNVVTYNHCPRRYW
ncbi:hypothetical protein BpJC7_20690 [Weizmannia acidilactici]|uniref:Spore coat protein D n=1 Tax=Weizmannia acidilactici TaxID=2607726 RepID=A0A5J4J764_9BACI|nr:hypothetical protein BpJC4_23390 [Weizmannia acidilactici]GER70766.1 hypothetical protein BpJC7_20690 [Weizmannia acidilactici]GER73711.1 hypothetical protein BpPP18_17780 [Weizmannia acidilactici]